MTSWHKMMVLRDWGFSAALAPAEARRQLRVSIGLGLALTHAAFAVLANNWPPPAAEARGGVLVLDWSSSPELLGRPYVYGG